MEGGNLPAIRTGKVPTPKQVKRASKYRHKMAEWIIFDMPKGEQRHDDHTGIQIDGQGRAG